MACIGDKYHREESWPYCTN